jgi:prepilin-type N-terminal cleavage/methylation domain-containing protein
MKTPHKSSAFTLIELLVVISIIGILITIAVPNISRALDKARMTETLANARSLQQATQMMTLDSESSGSGLQWTMQTPANGGEATPAGLNTFLSALTDDGYMTNQEMRKVLSAPGKSPQPGAFSSSNIAFKIFAVSSLSPGDQPFLVTANVSPGSGMNASQQPYGNKGFVVFNKGGGGGVYTRASDATSTNLFPTGAANSGDAQGPQYKYDVLN